MNTYLLATVIALATAASCPAHAGSCSEADKQLSKRQFATWNDSYEYFVRYKGGCSDAALGEALSSQHTQLLDKTAPKLGTLKRLVAQNPAYLNWLLLGVFYNPEETEVNAKNTACRILKRLFSCVPAEKELCAKLATRVGPSLEYVQGCSN